jgi:hypothetical protein
MPHYVLHTRPSCEGGPDVERVCGVYSTTDKAKEAKDRLAPEGDCLEIVECQGLVFVERTYDYHGEQQVEVVETFGTATEATAFVATHQEQQGDYQDYQDYQLYVVEYAIDRDAHDPDP